MTPEQQQYSKELTEAYGRMIALADRHISAIAPPLTVSLDVLSVPAAQQAAERDCWGLFRNGLQHLQQGGPGGRPGQFVSALAKASLRSSPAAQALGVKQPIFEGIAPNFDYVTGDLEALYISRLLIKEAIGDSDRSSQIIQRAVGMSAQPLEQPETSVQDRELALIFAAVRKNIASQTAAADIGSLQASIRKQAMMTANLQPEIYRTVGRALAAEIMAQYTAPAPPKGPSFGL